MKSINVYSKVNQKVKLGLSSYGDLFGPAVKQNFLSFQSSNSKLSRDLYQNGEMRYTLDELIVYFQIVEMIIKMNKELVSTAVLMKEYEKLCQKFKFHAANMHLRPVLPKSKSSEKPKPRVVPPDDSKGLYEGFI